MVAHAFDSSTLNAEAFLRVWGQLGVWRKRVAGQPLLNKKSLTQKTKEHKTKTEKKKDKDLEGIFLINDLIIEWLMRAYPAHYGWYQSWMMVMASTRKQTEQAIVIKSVSSTLWPLCWLPSSGSFPFWVPVLSSINDEQHCESVR